MACDLLHHLLVEAGSLSVNDRNSPFEQVEQQDGDANEASEGTLLSNRRGQG
jgi:hypothetical protein